ncbi:hypothetical protein FHG87_002161 [Trinorchestia longiramus]|nr:hypothetical protein FHG87_002161 [Trinorchestia longiramus]
MQLTQRSTLQQLLLNAHDEHTRSALLCRYDDEDDDAEDNDDVGDDDEDDDEDGNDDRDDDDNHNDDDNDDASCSR